ncbi:7TM chemoreceptor [Oesophagostomum dentatum]|uniref:7TM chemoreceptor n=1 Tax=Oesophagostomum dentatum TaxID=61180 RepID=A0A0B1T8B9_OESDE|nr:7TM chemoreceptor [Oesophagostomum dentatum]
MIYDLTALIINYYYMVFVVVSVLANSVLIFLIKYSRSKFGSELFTQLAGEFEIHSPTNENGARKRLSISKDEKTLQNFHVDPDNIRLSFYALTFYLLLCKSPHSPKGFKILLINTAANQLLVALIESSLQERMLPAGTVLALLPVGPLRHFGPAVCFIAYNLINAINLNVGVSVFHSMYFRYRLIKATQLSSRDVMRNLLITAILPLFLIISPHIYPFRFDIVMEAAIRSHPEYDLKEYGPFGGFKSTTDPVFVINSVILYTASVSLPTVIFYWRHRILRTLNHSGGAFTEKTRQNSRTLLRALTAQALSPLICYVPVGLFYFLSQFRGNSFAAGEYLMPIFTTLPCAIDPLLTIYFITPYRNWIIRQFRSRVVPNSTRVRMQNTIVSVASRRTVVEVVKDGLKHEKKAKTEPLEECKPALEQMKLLSP